MEKVLHRWLPLQCRILGGSVSAVVLVGPPDRGPYEAALHWPEASAPQTHLSRVIAAALRSRQTVLKTRNTEAENTGEPRDGLACPLMFDGRLCGVAAFDMPHRSQPLQRVAVQQVRAGVIWLETMLGLEAATASDQRAHLVDLVAAGLEHERYAQAATEVANELHQRFGCQRVSFGFLRYGRVRVEAISHTHRVETNSGLVRSMSEAMSEAIDQQTTVVFPPPEAAPLLVTRFHGRLAEAVRGATFCTIPLAENGRPIGALLLERPAQETFDSETVTRCEQISMLLGPLLQVRRRDDRPLPVKIVDALRRFLIHLVGPRHPNLKLAAGLVVTLILMLSLVTAEFRITGDSALEAGVRRSVVAPQAGYIARAEVRAGDLVREGQLLATLDDRELLQEQRKWHSQRGQLLKEYRKALANGERSEVAILAAKRGQVEAQLKLVDRQLERTHLVAPFPGLVVAGDLSQSLGSPVERGEILFEVAPMDDFRVVLKIDDHDIGFVEAGQQGVLKLAGLPDREIGITIDRLTPVATSEAGRNYFRVEAILETRSDLMRPGMAGVAKIEVGRENLFWIGTRRLVNWLRVLAWTRLP